MSGLGKIELASVRCESYPIRGVFTISRGSKWEARVVVVELVTTLADGRTVRGCGECVPYARYGETVDGVIADIAAQSEHLVDRETLQKAMPLGAARNAIDCAFWDLEAKAAGLPVWQLAGLGARPQPLLTAYTLSLGTPDQMGEAAKANAHMPVLKLKLGSAADDFDRLTAVRHNAPNSRIIVDVNEGWTIEQLKFFAPQLAELGVVLIEQPLPADADEALSGFASPVPLGADESCHGIEGLAALANRYRVVNLKLDKTGGLTEALRLRKTAIAMGFDIMVGCMVGTSLSMAPAFLLAQGAAFVDLDGPLLLENDRSPGLVYQGATVSPPTPALWG